MSPMGSNIFVYKKIDDSNNESSSHQRQPEDLSQIKKELNNLLNKALEIKPPISYELFPSIAIYLKWRFDYLANTRQSPFLIGKDINYWNTQLDMMIAFQREKWINQKNIDRNSSIINNIQAYNFMWPKNTDEETNFNDSKKIAELRMGQISKIAKDQFSLDAFKDKIVLDSGCGPGRYINAIKEYEPQNITGIDSGGNIIKSNTKRFKGIPNISFVEGDCKKLPFDDNSFDFVLSAGVLHHVDAPINKTIEDHSRVLKPGGLFFIFLVGEGGMELEIWNFCEKLLANVPIDYVYERFKNSIHHLRLQGILDHSFSSYFQTNRNFCEKLLDDYFEEFVRVPGVKGLDVTSETFSDDAYFETRFGSGNLRYLCKK